MGQLLDRIEHRLSAVHDPVERAELEARRAVVLARIGREAESLQLVRELRRTYGDGRSGRVTVWMMVAEGVARWLGSFDHEGIDRLNRAQLLGSAMGYAEVVAVACAWKALIQFNRSDYIGMLGSLATAQSHVTAADHHAKARLAMNLAVAFNFVGRWDCVSAWFRVARHHAAEDGDIQAVEAMQHNRAACSIAYVTAQKAAGRNVEQNLETIRREYLSVAALRRMAGIHVHEERLRLLEARLYALDGDHAKAIPVLRKVIDASPPRSQDLNDRSLHLELAHCMTVVGDRDGAIELVREIDQSSFVDLDVDDQLICARMQWEMARADRRFGDELAFRERLDRLADVYISAVEQLGDSLLPYEKPPSLARAN